MPLTSRCKGCSLPGRSRAGLFRGQKSPLSTPQQPARHTSRQKRPFQQAEGSKTPDSNAVALARLPRPARPAPLRLPTGTRRGLAVRRGSSAQVTQRPAESASERFITAFELRVSILHRPCCAMRFIHPGHRCGPAGQARPTQPPQYPGGRRSLITATLRCRSQPARRARLAAGPRRRGARRSGGRRRGRCGG